MLQPSPVSDPGEPVPSVVPSLPVLMAPLVPVLLEVSVVVTAWPVLAPRDEPVVLALAEVAFPLVPEPVEVAAEVALAVVT